MAKSSLYEWRAGMRKAGMVELEEEFHFDRAEDDARVISSCLPHWDSYRTSAEEFTKDNLELQEFLRRYPKFMIKMRPKSGTKGLSRYYLKGIRNWNNCQNFLKETAAKYPSFKENFEKYNISLAEYEISTYGGVIISNQKTLSLDILKEYYSRKEKERIGGLAGLCDNQEIPDLSIQIELRDVGHCQDKTTYRTKRNKDHRKFHEIPDLEKEKIRKLLKVSSEALRYIELTRDNFNPLFMPGYFEFVYAKKAGIKFIDFKDNPKYYE